MLYMQYIPYDLCILYILDILYRTVQYIYIYIHVFVYIHMYTYIYAALPRTRPHCVLGPTTYPALLHTRPRCVSMAVIFHEITNMFSLYMYVYMKYTYIFIYIYILNGLNSQALLMYSNAKHAIFMPVFLVSAAGYC